MVKKALYLLVLLVFLVSCGEEDTGITKITVMTEGDTQSWDVIELENCEINVWQVPEGTIAEQVLSAEERPDIVYLKSVEDMEAISEYLVSTGDVQLDGYDLAKFSNKDYVEIEARHADKDGGHYVFPDYSVSRDGVERAWLYRADIFEQNGIAIPETMSQLKDACIKLKALYPDSTPLVIKNGYTGLDTVAPSWKNNASLTTYYDFKEGKWCYGLSEPWAGNFISYWSNMHKAGLIPQNYLTMEEEEAEKLIEDGKAFIVPDYLNKIDEYKENSGGDWRIMPPPRADIETGQHKIAKSIAPFAGIAVLKGEEERENAAFAVVEAYFSNYVDSRNEQSENVRLARIYTENNINPTRYLRVPVGEDEMRVNTHLHGMLAAFLKSEIPMTRWADFAAQLKEKGTEEMIKLHRSAYNDAKK